MQGLNKFHVLWKTFRCFMKNIFNHVYLVRWWHSWRHNDFWDLCDSDLKKEAVEKVLRYISAEGLMPAARWSPVWILPTYLDVIRKDPFISKRETITTMKQCLISLFPKPDNEPMS